MEFAWIKEKYKLHSPRKFFEDVSQGRVMEIRIVKDYKGVKFTNYNLIRSIAEQYSLESRFTSFYINNYDDLHKILYHKLGNHYLTRLYNIFISVNPKRKVNTKSKNGLIFKTYQGGYAGTSHIQNFLADIEHKERQGFSTEAMLKECLDGAMFLVDMLKLKSYYVNCSGNGSHLWAPLEEAIEVPIPPVIERKDKLFYNHKDPSFAPIKKSYWKFITDIDKMLNKYNPKLKVDDGAKDFTRIARPPGSMNVKQGFTPRFVGTVYYDNQIGNILKQKITSAIPILKRAEKKQLKIIEKSRIHRYNRYNIVDSPLYKLLVSGILPSILSRNHYLESSFARLLRDNNISPEDITEEVDQINAVQGKEVQIDPEYLADEEPFNSETVNSYCIACNVDLVYPLLEEIPDISREYITEDHYNLLNSYSDITINKMALQVVKPETYLGLKNLIRSLVDNNNDRTTIFFTLKKLYSEEWMYYDKNKIILQLLNKTRKREEK